MKLKVIYGVLFLQLTLCGSWAHGKLLIYGEPGTSDECRPRGIAADLMCSVIQSKGVITDLAKQNRSARKCVPGEHFPMYEILSTCRIRRRLTVCPRTTEMSLCKISHCVLNFYAAMEFTNLTFTMSFNLTSLVKLRMTRLRGVSSTVYTHSRYCALSRSNNIRGSPNNNKLLLINPWYYKQS